MSKGVHPKVTIWKVRNTLRTAGISEVSADAILAQLRGEAKRSIGSLRLKRGVQKKILQALANDGKCGLYLADNGKIRVAGADAVKFWWEKGKKALAKYRSEANEEGEAEKKETAAV